ncbi:MAG: outer membrane beta-barrel protein [Chitinophagaceae bacterium]|nr:outer membrane beta-barrel protein [Chitinophagaceae bacterium]
MKKLFLSLFVFVSVSSNAQVSAGITAGFSSTDIGNMDLATTKRLSSVNGGLLLDYQFPASGLHLQSGIIYSPMGFGKSDITAVDNTGKNLGNIESHRISYIQVPAYLTYGSLSINFALRGGIGPFIGFKTSDKLIVTGGEHFGNGTALPGNTTALKNIVAGAGLHLSANFYHYQIAFEFQQTFTGLYENKVSSAQKWNTNSFGIKLGYFFRTVHEGF